MKFSNYLTEEEIKVDATGLKHSGDPDSDYDSDQLKMGIEVEKEHSDDMAIRTAIAKAHLAEAPTYYTALKKMEDGLKKPVNESSDEENPDYMFQMIHTKLLLMVATKKIDAVKLAKTELAQRGLGKSGSWVGFDKAKTEWGV